jgi:imidazolonepropionase-like amidohydrolase
VGTSTYSHRPTRRRWPAALALLLTVTGAYAARASSPFAADPYPSTYRPLPRSDTLIVGATILDGAGRRIADGEVLIRDGRIVEVGHDLSRDGVTVIDAQGRYLTPGIIDVHSHDGTFPMPYTSGELEASDVSETSDPDAAGTWIEHAVNPQDPAFAAALRSGVTTLQILPGSVPLFGGRAVVVKPVPATNVPAMKFPGARPALKMSCGENPKSYFGEKDRAPNSRQGEVALVRAALLEAQTYRRKWQAWNHGDADTPPERDLALDTLAGVLDGDIAVHMHCYRASDMIAMLGVAREFGFSIAAFHHATEGYKITAELKEAGTCAAVWPDWWGFKMEVLDAVRANAAMLDTAGVCVTMHSDGPIVGQRLVIEAAKAAAAGRQAGIDLLPEQVIRWVTSTPAGLLGLGERIGTIAPGYNADLVIWSADPFSIRAKADQVFIDGALAYDRSAGKDTRSDFELGRPETGIRP